VDYSINSNTGKKKCCRIATRGRMESKGLLRLTCFPLMSDVL